METPTHSAVMHEPARLTSRTQTTPRAKRIGAPNDVVLLTICLVLCSAYLLLPSLPVAAGVCAIGGLLILLRPELAILFLAFGWIAQRQLATYWTGVPLLLLGFLGAALWAPLGLRSLSRDKPFLIFLAISALVSFLSLLARPAWQAESANRLIYMAAGLATYLLCKQERGRRYAEVAAVACGVAISLNAIARAQDLGLLTLRSGDVSYLKLNDSNYASIPIVFGTALVLEWLSRGQLTLRKLPVAVASLGIMVWGLLMLASRGGQLAFLAVIGVWMFRLIFSRRGSGKFARLVLALLTVGVIFVLGRAVISDELLLTNRLRWEDAVQSRADDRAYILKDSFDIILSRPWVVLGGGIGRNIDLLMGINTHNQPLDTLFDYGLIGIASLIWLWSSFLRSDSARTDRKVALQESTLLAATGLGAASMALSPIWFPFFWVQIGYLAACTFARTHTPEEPVLSPIARRRRT